jgi:hypothetical protein
VTWIFSLMQFWTFAGDLFDTRQAKRLYPAIGVRGLVGMNSVGLVSRQLIRAIGAENLLLLWALLIFIALVPGSISYRRYRKVEDPPKRDLIEAATLILGSAWMSIRYGFPSVVSTKLGDSTMLYTYSDSS